VVPPAQGNALRSGRKANTEAGPTGQAFFSAKVRAVGPNEVSGPARFPYGITLGWENRVPLGQRQCLPWEQNRDRSITKECLRILRSPHSAFCARITAHGVYLLLFEIGKVLSTQAPSRRNGQRAFAVKWSLVGPQSLFSASCGNSALGQRTVSGTRPTRSAARSRSTIRSTSNTHPAQGPPLAR